MRRTPEDPEHDLPLTLLRMDFAARVRTADDSERQVLIEIQKANAPTVIERFRRYLGQQIGSGDNILTHPSGRTEAVPIVTIYFLGYALDELSDEAVIDVCPRVTERRTGRKLAASHPLVEGIHHRSHIIQIPRLTSRRRKRVGAAAGDLRPGLGEGQRSGGRSRADDRGGGLPGGVHLRAAAVARGNGGRRGAAHDGGGGPAVPGLVAVGVAGGASRAPSGAGAAACAAGAAACTAGGAGATTGRAGAVGAAGPGDPPLAWAGARCRVRSPRRWRWMRTRCGACCRDDSPAQRDFRSADSAGAGTVLVAAGAWYAGRVRWQRGTRR